ncbi:MAG: polysaccharide deacetylase family protein [Myxococcota bacterium]
MVRLGATAGATIALSGLAATAGALGWIGPQAVMGACALCFLALLGVVAWGSADPALQLFGPAVLRASTGRKEVALTFDDGPDPTSTPALLAALAAADARATFFLLVDRAEAHPELTRAIAEAHEVGLHGMSHHPWLTIRGVRAGTEELAEARRRLEALVGRSVTGFRPPFGAVSPRLLASVAAAGMDLIWCSVRTRDGGAMPRDEVISRCARAGAGDIVLLHEGRAPTTEALPHILSDLQSRGLRAVTVEALCASP